MRRLALAALVAIALAGCAQRPGRTLKLATTTSTYDSGLLDALLPAFEQAERARVEVIAVGTGQAIALGERGDADVLLVHSARQEEAFVQAGLGEARIPVMYNDFVLLGPGEDPAGIAGDEGASHALAEIARQRLPFASRGDDSGTHDKEREIWAQAGLEPCTTCDWYLSLGQGMAETLQFAAERGAYTLSDRGTYLALQSTLPGLAVMVGGDSIAENPDAALRNPYSVIVVLAGRDRPTVLAEAFASWLTSLPTQQRIAEYGRDQYGQPLFYPDSDAWRRDSSP